MSPMVWTILTFLAAVLTFAAAYSVISDLFLRDRARLNQRMDDEFRQNQRARVRKSSLFKNLQVMNDLAALETERIPWSERVELFLDQSGLNLTVRWLVLLILLTGVGIGGAVGLFSRSPLMGLGAGFLGSIIPVWYVYLKRRSRLDKMMAQLPDTFELMSRVIRAGHTITQAFQSVSEEFAAPVGTEFAYSYEQQNLGLPPEVALRDLARRSGLVEIRIFVLALLVQQQTGGNLAEMLDKLAGVIRDRIRILGKIQSLTAEGRLQAVVLLAMPPVLLLALMILNNAYAMVLINHPYLLVAMFIAEAIGAVWIRKIVHFDF